MNTYRRAIFSRVSFFTRGTSRALQTRITSTPSWACITTSTLGPIFASRTWWTWGPRIALGEHKDQREEEYESIKDTISHYCIQIQKNDPLFKNYYY